MHPLFQTWARLLFGSFSLATVSRLLWKLGDIRAANWHFEHVITLILLFLVVLATTPCISCAS
jgi:hypothetical protein